MKSRDCVLGSPPMAGEVNAPHTPQISHSGTSPCAPAPTRAGRPGGRSSGREAFSCLFLGELRNPRLNEGVLGARNEGGHREAQLTGLPFTALLLSQGENRVQVHGGRHVRQTCSVAEGC